MLAEKDLRDIIATSLWKDPVTASDIISWIPSSLIASSSVSSSVSSSFTVTSWLPSFTLSKWSCSK